MRFVGLVVAGVDDCAHHIARFEIDELVGSGAHRLQVGRRFARLGAAEGRENVLGDQLRTAVEAGPEGCRLVEHHADGVRVDLLDLQVGIHAGGDAGGGRVDGVQVVEYHVVGGEGRTVVPGHTLLQLPQHPLAVRREAAVFAAGDFGRQHRHQVAVGIPARQRLVEDGATFRVLGAGGEVRVQQRRALPVQKPQRATAPTFRRLVVEGRLCVGHAGVHQHQPAQGGGNAQCCQALDEIAPQQLAAAHLRHPAFQLRFTDGRIVVVLHEASR